MTPRELLTSLQVVERDIVTILRVDERIGERSNLSDHITAIQDVLAQLVIAQRDTTRLLEQLVNQHAENDTGSE